MDILDIHTFTSRQDGYGVFPGGAAWRYVDVIIVKDYTTVESVQETRSFFGPGHAKYEYKVCARRCR